MALEGLNDNGGPSRTHALSAGSPAIGAGINLGGLTTDQRGPNFPRTVNGNTDIGAFEYAPPPSVTPGPLANVTGGTFYDFSVTYGGTTPINASTIDNMDILASGPNGYSQLAALVSVDQPGNGTPRTATYRITAPGGSFDAGDNGTYALTLRGGQVVTLDGGTNPPLQVGTVQVAIPAVFTVTNLNDTGPGSLRQAIFDANANNNPNLQDAINFQAGLTGSINLTSQLAITQNVAINGPGAQAVVVSGSNAVRVFNVDGPGRLTVRLSGLFISGGNVEGDGGGIFEADEDLTLDRVFLTGNRTTGTAFANSGGGIAVGTGGWLTVRDSTISGNQAGSLGNNFASGGGIYFYSGGSLLMENSTVSGNAATGTRGGGGMYFFGAPTASGVTIRNSTIANNLATSGAGVSFFNLNTVNAPVVIQNSTITGNSSTTNSTTPGYGGGGLAIPTIATTPGATAVLTIASTIVAGNAANAVNGRSDIAVPVAARVNVNFSAIGDPDGFTPSGTSANNLPFGVPLGLGTLANNGGPTPTIAFAANSPLRNAGSNPANLATDQRGPGFARFDRGLTDIGAYEFQSAPRVVGFNVNGGFVAQRSRVTRIDITFSATVTFAGSVASAFQLSRIGGGGVGSFTATANVVGGVTVVTLTDFAGTETQFGSLADGRYTLLVRANQVSASGLQLDGDGNGNGGDDFTLNGSVANGLYRLFGDVNADGVVNAFDFSQFRGAFGSSTGQAAYVDWLDINGDGTINAFDFGQFRPRFGSGVP